MKRKSRLCSSKVSRPPPRQNVAPPWKLGCLFYIQWLRFWLCVLYFSQPGVYQHNYICGPFVDGVKMHQKQPQNVYNPGGGGACHQTTLGTWCAQWGESLGTRQITSTLLNKHNHIIGNSILAKQNDYRMRPVLRKRTTFLYWNLHDSKTCIYFWNVTHDLNCGTYQGMYVSLEWKEL